VPKSYKSIGAFKYRQFLGHRPLCSCIIYYNFCHFSAAVFIAAILHILDDHVWCGLHEMSVAVVLTSNGDLQDEPSFSSGQEGESRQVAFFRLSSQGQVVSGLPVSVSISRLGGVASQSSEVVTCQLQDRSLAITQRHRPSSQVRLQHLKDTMLIYSLSTNTHNVLMAF